MIYWKNNGEQIVDVIHPSVIFHNKKYWMAYTPFPNQDTKKENPSILVSDNGIEWEEPCKNPLVSSPENGYNNDPFLIYDNGFRIYYRHYYLDNSGQEYGSLKLLTSPDGENWEEPKEIYLVKGVWVSPCILDNSLWFVRAQVLKKGQPQIPVGIFYIDNIIEGEKKVNIDIPFSYPWHFEIRKEKDLYRMALSMFHQNEYHLFNATSPDKIKWNIEPLPLLKSYKASIIKEDKLKIWYSFLENNRWVIHYFEI